MTGELCEGCTALARRPVTVDECAAGLRRAAGHRDPAAELGAAVGVALAVPQGRPGSIAHSPVRERLWQALKAWRSQT